MKNILTLMFLSVLIICLSTTLRAQKSKETIKINEKKTTPYALIDGIRDSVIEKNIFMKVDKLSCSDNKYKIVSFTMSLRFKNGDLKQVFSKSNIITPDMKKYISEKELEGRIWIKDIQSQAPDGKLIDLPAIAFKIH